MAARRKKRKTQRALGDDPLAWINEETEAAPPPPEAPAVEPSMPETTDVPEAREAADTQDDARPPGVSPAGSGPEHGRLVLEPILTIAEAVRVREQLLMHVNDPVVELDGSAVEHADTAGMQLLLAFAGSVASRGGRLTWSGCSPALSEVAGLLGISSALGLDG